MNDTIYRQAAIEEIEKTIKVNESVHYEMKYWKDGMNCAKDIIEEFPSAQPEIIHCKECKYGVQDEDKRWYCRGLGCQVGEADGSGFCADAERRTDE